MLPSFFCVIISIGDDMKIIKKLLVIAFYVFYMAVKIKIMFNL